MDDLDDFLLFNACEDAREESEREDNSRDFCDLLPNSCLYCQIRQNYIY